MLIIKIIFNSDMFYIWMMKFMHLYDQITNYEDKIIREMDHIKIFYKIDILYLEHILLPFHLYQIEVFQPFLSFVRYLLPTYLHIFFIYDQNIMFL